MGLSRFCNLDNEVKTVSKFWQLSEPVICSVRLVFADGAAKMIFILNLIEMRII